MELRTFGGLAACSDSGPLEGAGTQKRRLALLVLVDVAGERGISRDKLLSYLWSDADAEKARGALAQALYSLRKSLGSEDLFLGTNELRLNRAVLDSDRSRFLVAISKGELEAAVATYAGPFLDGFYLSDAVEFEIWVDAERVALAHKYVGALQQLAARAEKSGDVNAAVAWWRKLVNVDPLNGQLALGLMRALAAAGDRSGAVQHARVYERLVQQELEVPGDQEVQAFVEELKRKPSPAVRVPLEAQVPVSDERVTHRAPPQGKARPFDGVPDRRSLAEELSTAEVVAVALSRLKASRPSRGNFIAANLADHQDDLTREPRVSRSVSDAQQRFGTDRYIIKRELGSGGMATVYLAYDVRHERDVAIKVLHDDLGAALGPERFLTEIKTTARLQHPLILPLLDSGTAGDGPSALLFYVMPYIAGETLRDRLTREKILPLDETLRIVRDVADALAYAHDQHLVHRDIKPENILLQGEHAMVADFGIALAAQTSAGRRVTHAGLSLGTPEYMAPEQAMGLGVVDHRADIYALGVVTYEMLTGDPPFTGATPQSIIAKMLTERPVAPRVVRDSIPVAVESAVLTALAKLPADRFARSTDYLRALTELPAGPLASDVPVAHRASRRNTTSIVFGVGAIALAAIAAIALRDRRSVPLVVGAVTQVTRAKDTLNFDAAISPDGKFVAYASGPIGRMHLVLRQVSGSTPVTIATGFDGDHRWPRWSPDGSRLAFVANKAIYVIPALGGSPRLLVRLGDLGGQPQWSPDGTQLAFADSGGISVIAATGGAPRRVIRMLEAHSPTWSPDGTRLGFVVENLSFVRSSGYGNAAPSAIWTVKTTGGDSALVTSGAHLNTSPVWWHDGRTILFVSDRDGTRDVYRQPVTGDGRPRGNVERVTSGLAVFNLTLTSDGSQMAYSTLLLGANIWMAPITADGLAPASLMHAVTTERQSIEGLSVSHSGNWLSYDSNRNGNLDIFRTAFDQTGATGDAVAITTDEAPDFEPRWSPDDSEVVFYSYRHGTRDLYIVKTDGRGEARLTSLPGQEYYPDWSPDGRRLVFSSQVSYGWDVLLMERDAHGVWGAPAKIGFTAQTGVNVRWMPDGQSLAVVRDSTLGLVSARGGAMHPLVNGRAIGESIVFIATSRDPSRVFFQTRDSSGMFSMWSVSTAGGAPRRLLRLAEQGKRSRRAEFDTDGTTLFFTIADDAADVAVVRFR